MSIDGSSPPLRHQDPFHHQPSNGGVKIVSPSAVVVLILKSPDRTPSRTGFGTSSNDTLVRRPLAARSGRTISADRA